MKYLVLDVESKVAKNGNLYNVYSLLSEEGTRHLVYEWFPSQDFPKGSVMDAELLNKGGYLHLVDASYRGTVKEFADTTAFAPFIELMPTREEWFTAVFSLMKGSSISDEVSKNAEELYTLYSAFYAATKNHHDYMGGLLQHTYEILKFLCGMKEHLAVGVPVRWDLCCIAALYHDYAKVYEYDMSGNYTEEIVLSYHTVTSANWMASRYEGILSAKEMNIVSHIIYSHHSKKEWGSPCTPACYEAFLVAQCDYLSGVLNSMKMTPHGERCPMGEHSTMIKLENYLKDEK